MTALKRLGRSHLRQWEEIGRFQGAVTYIAALFVSSYLLIYLLDRFRCDQWQCALCAIVPAVIVFASFMVLSLQLRWNKYMWVANSLVFIYGVSRLVDVATGSILTNHEHVSFLLNVGAFFGTCYCCMRWRPQIRILYKEPVSACKARRHVETIQATVSRPGLVIGIASMAGATPFEIPSTVPTSMRCS